MAGIEVGQAYVRIIPTAKGIGSGIGKELDKSIGSVGAPIGEKVGKNIVQKIGESIQKGGGKIQSASKKLGAIGGTLTKSLTVPTTALGVASGKMAMDFESSMAKVSTLVDTNSVDMSKLQSDVEATSKKYGISASDVAEATYQAISAGQDAGDAVGFVDQSLGLAKAGFTDASTAVDTMTTVLNAYGMSADQAQRVSDTLITTQNLGKRFAPVA